MIDIDLTLLYNSKKSIFSRFWCRREITTELSVQLVKFCWKQNIITAGIIALSDVFVNIDWTADTNPFSARNRCWNPELWQWFTICCNTKLPAYVVTWAQASHWWCRSSRRFATACGIFVALWPVMW